MEENNISETKKDKVNLDKKEEKVPASKIDKCLNYTIYTLLFIILGLVIFFTIQIFKTKQTEVPKIEKAINEYKNKEKYTYLVNIEDTKNNKSMNIKITKIDDILEYQLNDGEEEYGILKKDKEDIIYLVKDGEVEELKDPSTDEYKKYLDTISKEYLNIKKYGPNSIIAMKDNNHIILSKKDGTKLQFESSTHMPSVFIAGDEKISFTFSNAEPKLILPYLKSQIDSNTKKLDQEKENKDTNNNNNN